MSDNHKPAPDTNSNNPKHRKFRRHAFSDHSMPAVLFVAVFSVLLVMAIVYVGYRVFQLESDRFDIETREKMVERQENLL